MSCPITKKKAGKITQNLTTTTQREIVLEGKYVTSQHL